jgi:hypothetical protein
VSVPFAVVGAANTATATLIDRRGFPATGLLPFRVRRPLAYKHVRP